METGKVFLVALIAVVSTYAATMAWPAIKELANPMKGSAVASAPATTLPSAPPAPASRGSVQRGNPIVSNRLPSALGSTPRHHRGGIQSVSAMPLTGNRSAAVPWTYAKSRYARSTVMMRAKPGSSEGVRPPSLNREGLRILRGTRLMPVKTQGEWVMVQSPSAELGWVHELELTDQRPGDIDSDHFALR